MECPRCNNPLIVLELDEIEIDYCSDCGGIWLDQGELELLIESSDEKDKLLTSFQKDNSVKEKLLKCPICRSKMNNVVVDNVNAVTVDVCKNQCGIWFDKGELLDVVSMGSVDKNNKIIKLLSEMFEYNINQNNTEE